MSDEIAIKVDNVSKTFKLPHEKNNSIKSAVVNFYKRNKSFEVQKALENVSFEVKKGEFFGIVGRNGSGKSTLLKMLAGIYSPSKGTITVNGKLTPFIELGVGFSPELTGRENVYLNGALLGFSRKEMRKMYRDIVDFAELRKFMDQKLKNYSSGMQVRLAFSIAIRAQSDILLLDEVLAVGDAAFQQKCYNYFEELKRQKRTVVFVSHDMAAIRRFCNKAVYIDSGKMTMEGSPSDIADEYIEENVEQANKVAGMTGQLSKNHHVAIKKTEQTEDKVIVEVSYKSKGTELVYAGISVLRDGMSVAEINSSGQLNLKGDGKITYTLDITPFNAGLYYMSVGLFSLKNKELISIGNKTDFIIKGGSEIKGAALKLDDTWEYK